MATNSRLPVVSSAIKSIGYNDARRTLEIEFKDGTVGRYKRVPKRLHTRLLNAPSIGGFFHTNIRDNPDFEYINVSASKGEDSDE